MKILFRETFTLLNLLFWVFSSSAFADILDIRLRKDMPYSQGKKLLVGAGWQYNSLPAYGYSETDPKVNSDCFGSVEICNSYPEIDACSGQGYCKMLFYDHFGNSLSVTTYGPLMSPELHVIGWRLYQASEKCVRSPLW